MVFDVSLSNVTIFSKGYQKLNSDYLLILLYLLISISKLCAYESEFNSRYEFNIS